MPLSYIKNQIFNKFSVGSFMVSPKFLSAFLYPFNSARVFLCCQSLQRRRQAQMKRTKNGKQGTWPGGINFWLLKDHKSLSKEDDTNAKPFMIIANAASSDTITASQYEFKIFQPLSPFPHFIPIKISRQVKASPAVSETYIRSGTD